jgi:C-terminal processing protease CtpA/Prc
MTAHRRNLRSSIPRILLLATVALAGACEPTRPLDIDGEEPDREFEDGSRIADQSLTAGQVENLAFLAEVWGFVKYHHPRVTGGGVNWDYELFRVMPAVLGAADGEAAAALVDWLARLGEPDPCSPCAAGPTNVHLPPPIDWILGRDRLGDDLAGRLERIHQRRGTIQYYAGQSPVAGNPQFGNEARYDHMTLPDAGYRLLSLFRFWNIIRYWFPYRDVMGEDWEGVLREFIPRLMAATTVDRYHLEMMLVTARVHDGHANLGAQLHLRPPQGGVMAPVITRFIEGRAVVTGYLHATLGPESGLMPGDVIETIDGRTVASLVDEWRPYYSASNEAARLRDMARNLTRGASPPREVTGTRDGVPFQLAVPRVPTGGLDHAAARTHDRPGPAFQRLTEEVAYVKLSAVQQASSTDYIRMAEGADVLVIDIRNYPSGFLVFTLGQHLVDAPSPFVRFTRSDPANPGAFLWDAEPTALTPSAPRFDGTVVILIDELTQSSAEYHAMAFRTAPRALVAGSTTAGADGNVSSIPLPGGIESRISGIGVFYPDRTPTQRIGIVPDLEVRPTIAGIREGRDEVLEAAVSHALGQEFRLPDG